MSFRDENGFLTISDEEYHYSAGYYTMNKWLDNERIVLIRSKDPTIGVDWYHNPVKCELVVVSLKEKTIKVICEDETNFENYVVSNNKIYYSNRTSIIEVDITTGIKRVIYQSEISADGLVGVVESPHLTKDGKVMSIFMLLEDKNTLLLTIDVETGTVLNLFKKRFEQPFYIIDHGMVCPTDADLVFFAHEGDTFYVSNRLWIYDAKNNTAHNIAKQSLNADGDLGDCFGHEMWSPDGKGIYFVKYPCSPEPPRGICYVDVATEKVNLLFSQYRYWHVSVSPDGKYLAADTQTGKNYSQVVVIDIENKTETVIEEAPTTWRHPCHPHPSISPDNSKVIYTTLTEEGRICVRVGCLNKEEK